VILAVLWSIRELISYIFLYTALYGVAMNVNLGYYEDVSTLALRVLTNVMENKLCY